MSRFIVAASIVLLSVQLSGCYGLTTEFSCSMDGEFGEDGETRTATFCDNRLDFRTDEGRMVVAETDEDSPVSWSTILVGTYYHYDAPIRFAVNRDPTTGDLSIGEQDWRAIPAGTMEVGDYVAFCGPSEALIGLNHGLGRVGQAATFRLGPCPGEQAS